MEQYLTTEQAIGQKLLLAFQGKKDLPDELYRALREYRPGGITLFRSLNIDNPAQLRGLTESLQQLAHDLDLPPLLIAADQEGGQLMAVGEGTPLPGNMAIGATGSEDLALRAGEVLGRELRAMGVNVNYAPCMDVNLNFRNPVVGIRSFGENAKDVARLGAAMLEGIQSQGVAATAKHFPGHGDTTSDSHYGLQVVSHSLERLWETEFVPFQAAIGADVKMVMTAHIGLLAVDGSDAPPATLSARVLKGILRSQLGFQGVIVTDALDMHAIRQGEELGGEAVKAAAAGSDLLMVTSNPQDQGRVHAALMNSALDGTLDRTELLASARRILDLKDWLSQRGPLPDLSVVGSAGHQDVAREIAERSITLVSDEARLLPLKPRAGDRIAVVVPRPMDLTPADTSSYIVPKLADSLRKYHANMTEFLISSTPLDAEIRALLQALSEYDLIVVGTLNAFEQAGQSTLVHELLKKPVPVVVIALRLPYDLMAFPEAGTYLCTYSIHEPSMQALAGVMFGEIPIRGRLPVRIPGLYESGFSLER